MIKIIFFLVLLSISLYAQLKEVSLALPWKHQFQFAGYYMAIQKGYYKDYGLHLTLKEFEPERDNVQSVLSLKSDFGIRHSVIILDKINKHLNVKLLAAMNQTSPLVLISRKTKSYQKLSDIKNKTVMMSSEDNGNAAIIAMLNSEGISINDYKVAPVSFNMDSFINGTIDFRTVYRSNEPYQLQKKGIAYNLYDPKDYGYDFYSDILFTSQALIDKDPQTVQNFYKASLKGWEYAYAHIDETIDVILKHYNSQNRTKEALLFEANTLKKLALVPNTDLGNINPIKLEEIANTYRLLGLIPHNEKINFDDFIYHISMPKKMTTEKTLQSLSSLYYTYHQLIQLFATVLILTILIAFYFRHRLKSLLLQKERELSKNYDIVNHNISVSRTDKYGKITYVSEAFCLSTGYSEDELLGHSHNMLKDKEHLASDNFYKELWMTIKSGHTWHGEFKNLNKDGSSVWVDSIITPMINSKKEIIGYEAIRQDATKKKLLQEFNEKLELEVKEQTLELSKSKDYLDTLFNINPNIAYVLKDNKLERVNNAFLEFTGYNSLEDFLKEHTCICELFEQSRDTTQNYIGQAQSHKHCTIDDKININKEEQEYTFLLTSNIFMVHQEERCLVILEDITSIEKVAVTDKLTTLYNRTKIDKILEDSLKKYKRYDENFSLILIDIDFFKNVNDTFGHQTGDDVLVNLAQLFKKNVRATDIVGRWGGEEFMIISPHTTKEDAFNLAKLIHKKVQEELFDTVGHLTISAGVSDIKECQDISNLIADADKKLYIAKTEGRNRVIK